MYQPKINPEAVLLGYLGKDPVKFGAFKGYSTRLTPPSKPRQGVADSAASNTKSNPYMK